jgi:hypothetical protein
MRPFVSGFSRNTTPSTSGANVARKKKKPSTPKAAMDTNEFTIEEIGSAAYLLTELISEVNPTISKAATYDVMLGFLIGPMDLAGARRAGKQIKKTSIGNVAHGTH